MFERTDLVFNTYSQFPQTFLTNHSKCRIYDGVIFRDGVTETLILHHTPAITRETRGSNSVGCQGVEEIPAFIFWAIAILQIVI